MSVEEIHADATLQYALLGVTAACGVLMISTVRYPVVPKISPRSFREQPVKMTVFTLAALVAIVSRGELLFPVLLVLIVSGPMFAAGRKVRGAIRRQDAAAEQDAESGEAHGDAKPTIDSST